MAESSISFTETEAVQPTPSRKPRYHLVVAALLALTVWIGGSFRFMGLNWDDFTYLHPDERYLTLLVLPFIGGSPEFTAHSSYPPQSVLVRAGDNRFVSYNDLKAAPGVIVGAYSAVFDGDAARWLAGDERAAVFSDTTQAVDALLRGEVDAVVLDQIDSTPFRSTTVLLSDLSSESVHRLKCEYHYPDSKGTGGYFDTACSPYNPHNANTFQYVYGTLPLFLAHFTSQFVQDQVESGSTLLSFQGGHLVWRALSAIFDTATILLIFFTGRRLHDSWVGLIAALLYACAPLAIQKAHFGTVNAITHFFVALALFFAVHAQFRNRWLYYAGFGIAVGGAVAGRINTAPLAGVIVLPALLHLLPVLDFGLPWEERRRILLQSLIGLFIAGFSAFIAFRIFNPYAFEGPGFFGIRPSSRWLEDVASGSFGVSGYSDGPPNWQWMGRSGYLFPLKDMLLWAMGIAFGLVSWFGWIWAGYRLLRGRLGSMANLIPFVWVLIYFGWLGRLWVMTVRYYLPMYGVLGILAGWVLVELYRMARSHDVDVPLTRILLTIFALILGGVALYQFNAGVVDATAVAAGIAAAILAAAAWIRLPVGWRALTLTGFVVGFTLLWALMFTNIYRNQLTRVQASRWQFENVSGDFSMRIDGAGEEVPLINVAVGNANSDSAENPDHLPQYASSYEEELPEFFEFVPAATGTISSIHAPHLGDPLDDPEAESLYLSISAGAYYDLAEGTIPLAEVTLTENFSRDEHILGSSYDIVLDSPIEVEAGKTYTLKVEALPGSQSIIGAGAVMLVEGPWDDRITTTQICQLPNGLTLADRPGPGLNSVSNCNGRESKNALVNSYDMFLSLDPDTDLKRNVLIEALDNGDYLAITSNRFYDPMARNPGRWPLTNRYYESLFNGELGYELAAVFDTSYEFGPFKVSDQHLPIYSSPAWLNEFEADEAFHVYDHPVVFIFKKSQGYSPQQTRLILNSVPVAQTNQITDQSTLVNVTVWPSIDAARAPTQLQFTEDLREIQTQGGTWSDRFFSDSPLNQIQPLGVVVWWVVIVLFGWAIWPVLFFLFPGAAHRGYAVSKFVGLLVVGWLLWVLASIRIPVWSREGVIGALVLIGALSFILVRRSGGVFGAYVRENWKRLAWIEAIMLALYVALIFVRMTNPDLWHYSKGGEKPMDFAYFNAVLRSTVFPPVDPWYAGGFINYYYFGFVMVGSPVLLTGIVPSFAYNLIIPTLFALTGIGAFSVAYNIVHHWREKHTSPVTGEVMRRLGNPWVAGIAALMFCVVLGNLDTIRVVGNGIARLGGYEQSRGIEDYFEDQYRVDYVIPDSELLPTEAVGFIQQQAKSASIIDRAVYEVNHLASLVGGMARGVGRMLSGEPLPIGADRWYWGPSRVLAEILYYPVERRDFAITEMPYFTFLYGDLHAHMINMPVLLFILFFLFNEFVQIGGDQRHFWVRFGALALGALSVGIIRATNTWDYPAFLILSLVAMTYFWWVRWRGLNRRSMIDFLVSVLGFGAMTLLFIVPYTAYYAAIYNSVDLWRDMRSPLWAYLDIHGLFIFLLISLLVWDTARWMRSIKLKALRGRAVFIYSLSAAIGGLLLSALVAGILEYQVALLVLPLVGWIALLFFRPDQSRPMQFVLVLAGFALMMTLGVELIVVQGDIGRQNTVFKFYMQAWLIFSVMGGAAFAWLLQSSDYWSNRLRTIWYLPLGAMLLIAAMYPVMGTRARSLERMAPQTPATLNGLDYMQYTQYSLYHFPEKVIDLNDEYKIIRWLQENVQGTPVIIEARSIASEYTETARIAINTGLPSVLGWNFHQRQQRTFDPLPSQVFQREANVKAFYTTDDTAAAVRILRHYRVEYIIFSEYDQFMAGETGLEKFDRMKEAGLIDVAYEEGSAIIFHVNHPALDQFVLEQEG